MRLFTEAEEQIEEPVQRNDDVGCYAAEDEDDRDGSNDLASGHSRTELQSGDGQLENVFLPIIILQLSESRKSEFVMGQKSKLPICSTPHSH